MVDDKAGKVTVDPGDRQLKEGMILIPGKGSGASRLRVVSLFPRSRDGGSRYALCVPVEEKGRKPVLPKVLEEFELLPL